jgi:hypothetical protein
MSECYSSEALFPNDPNWGRGDFLDHVVMGQTLHRRMFGGSYNGTCVPDPDPDDESLFLIPMNACVDLEAGGPFGFFQLTTAPPPLLGRTAD